MSCTTLRRQDSLGKCAICRFFLFFYLLVLGNFKPASTEEQRLGSFRPCQSKESVVASHKILVIDDSRVIRARVREMLPQGNFEVIEATDGIEGIEAIRAQKPNLIMLDFLLPRMSGYEVYEEIQSDPAFQSIPLVMMSGRREELTEKIQEPFEFFEFIEKPFEQKELIGAIKGAMAKARKARPQKAAASAPEKVSAGVDASAEIANLQKQIDSLQRDVAALKAQNNKILAFIKKKLA